MESAVLYASLPDLNLPLFLAPAIAQATQRTLQHLLIVLVADFFDVDHPISHSAAWNDVQRLLTFVYVQATKVAQDMNRVLLQIDVLLNGPCDPLPDSVAPHGVFRVEGDPVALPLRFASLLPETLSRGSSSSPPPPLSPTTAPPSSPSPSRFPVVVLGGTFDHLHAGHKILLSMAAWLASEKVIVGVTDDALLVRKAYAEVLEPLAQRTATVRAFLSALRPALSFDIVPINDVYGPTSWDPNIQALVVSKETASGAASIANYRAEHGLPALETFTIDVISATETSLSAADADLLKQTKMSSTYIREWIVQNSRQ
ncbi:hypothetical protein GGX14DRAFT_436121 [Mycena pura]|uniref:Cytidyltransferase-like domain-containing protein n=1 Tax=Mycena pura TaxID=153505 RepID=A0AAD6VWC7_9AGAR|nr:hypothetical protein GGX14DRAFT_436121 [Mycena pura]